MTNLPNHRHLSFREAASNSVQGHQQKRGHAPVFVEPDENRTRYLRLNMNFANSFSATRYQKF